MDSSSNTEPITLNYVILNPRTPITMNLIEAEKYESAVVVQQLIGTLTYFSNTGRYEPRLAQSWTFDENKKWTFRLRAGLKCENGEEITPQSYKKSLERSLFIYSKIGGVPLLNFLEGYDEFILANKDVKELKDIFPIQGISTTTNDIEFTFNKKIRSGLLQILSFSPLGYLCEGNFNSAGEWADSEKLISSGPYTLQKISIGKEYLLERNPNWSDFSENSPQRILVTHQLPSEDQIEQVPRVVDAFTSDIKIPVLENYRLVPEYFNSVLLGNLQQGVFKDINVRSIFAAEFANVKNSIIPISFGIHTRADSFYPTQATQITPPQASAEEIFQKTIHANEKSSLLEYLKGKKLIIEGEIPPEGNFRWSSWQVLEKTIKNLGMKYEFSKTPANFEHTTSPKYDIRIRGSSIGGGVEPWGLFVIFCSSMGIKYPDPSDRVCQMVQKYENGEINLEQITQDFLSVVQEDKAIMPVSHYGVQLYISNHIEADSLSPLMSIMRFDQMRITK